MGQTIIDGPIALYAIVQYIIDQPIAFYTIVQWIIDNLLFYIPYLQLVFNVKLFSRGQVKRKETPKLVGFHKNQTRGLT
jgi:hypothetical protein